jgi:hypothetical protein
MYSKFPWVLISRFDTSFAANNLPPICTYNIYETRESSYAVSVTYSRQMTFPICASNLHETHKLSYAASVPHSCQITSPTRTSNPHQHADPAARRPRIRDMDPAPGHPCETPGSGPSLIFLIHISHTSTKLCHLPRIQFLTRMTRPRIPVPDPTPPRSRVRMMTQAGRIFISLLLLY